MGFMNFLDTIDDRYKENEFIEESVEDEDVLVPMPKLKRSVRVKRTSKESSVKFIEERIKNKLDDVGLNDKVISEVLDYVFQDIGKVKGLNEHKVSTSKRKPIKAVEPLIASTVMGRAEDILGDLMFETPTNMSPSIDMNNEQGNMMVPSMSSLNMDRTTDHATALLM